MNDKKKLLIWNTNEAGKLGVTVNIQLSTTPQVMLEGRCVDLPRWQPTLTFFIKEFRLAYTTKELQSWLEITIENYVSEIYPGNAMLQEEAAEHLAPILIEYLTPYILHVREHGLQEPPP